MAELPLLIGRRKETQYTRIGYGESALKTARTYIRAVFEFALDEGIIQRNPAKRLELPPTRKVCERFLSMKEVHALIAAAAGREKLVLRLFLVAGLRPAELFALKTDDILPGQLRIDRAVKEREKQAAGRRLGLEGTQRPKRAIQWFPSRPTWRQTFVNGRNPGPQALSCSQVIAVLLGGSEITSSAS